MRSKLLAFILVLAVINGGCWDIQELSDLSIVIGTAVDKGADNKYELTIQSPKHTATGTIEEKNKNRTNFMVDSAEGATVFEAARNLTEALAERNYWPHAQVVVIGEKLAQENIKSLVDFFARDSQRRTTLYFVVGEGKSKNFLELPPPKTELLTSFSIKDIITQTSSTGYGVNVPLYKFMSETTGITGVSLLNQFAVNPESVTEENSDANKEILLKGTSVFYNYQMIGSFTKKETQALNWLRNTLKTSVLSLSDTDSPYGEMALEISKSETKLIPLVSADGYIMKAAVNIKGNIVEYSGTENLNDIDLEKLGQFFASQIQEDIETVFQKAQNDLKVDPFKFGSKFSAQYPYLIKLTPQEWNGLFAENLELDLNVKVKVEFSGIMN
ncbi:MAG: Ger(x)C family spore germination protein [Peptococcaceae bacterium]